MAVSTCLREQGRGRGRSRGMSALPIPCSACVELWDGTNNLQPSCHHHHCLPRSLSPLQDSTLTPSKQCHSLAYPTPTAPHSQLLPSRAATCTITASAPYTMRPPYHPWYQAAAAHPLPTCLCPCPCGCSQPADLPAAQRGSHRVRDPRPPRARPTWPPGAPQVMPPVTSPAANAQCTSTSTQEEEGNDNDKEEEDYCGKTGVRQGEELLPGGGATLSPPLTHAGSIQCPGGKDPAAGVQGAVGVGDAPAHSPLPSRCDVGHRCDLCVTWLLAGSW
ncbi:hypothetical protein V8C86DRAFT_733655 [Haematococcus lacustris]